MVDHLDDNAASEFVSGALSEAALGKAERHLAGCRDCRALVAALAQGTGDDSQARTFKFDLSSQLTELPKKALSVGDRVGRYLVLSSIGAGGMGVVFAAYDPQLDRKIALKLLRSGMTGSDTDARARLRREAQAIAQLSHPNVVSVYDVGTTDDGDLYMAMEFVEGDTLTSWLRKYPRTWREIIDVFLQAARGLVAAHGVGLLHRDFKPDNVLVGGDGRVRVTDFGLARSVLAPDELARARPELTALDVALTATGTVLGTPRYMPPEQITGQDLDARSDQFSFCVALYEALYGCHPLPGGTSVRMLEGGDRAMPPPEGSKLPPVIARTVLRGLERDRARRFPTMAALITELVPVPHRASARYALLGLAGVVVLGGAGAWVMARPPLEPPAKPDQTVMQQLIDEKRGLEQELRRLRAEMQHRADADHDEVHQLELQLREKQAKLEVLTATVARYEKGRGVAVRAAEPSRRPAVAPIQQITEALDGTRGPVLACFTEWAQRNAGTRDEVAAATLVVLLTISADGHGSMERIVSTPDHHAPTDDGMPGRSMLEFCVSEQAASAHFPAGIEPVDIEVAVQWTPGQIRMLPKVTIGPVMSYEP
ncbi:MAG TPA: serine/threonine-protein kinase [Kofleriaceae bacterium]